MYESFYNFKEKPFNLTPDPKFLYFSKHHQGAMDHMLYGIREREGFIVILGGIGAGKTTLSRCLLNRLDEKVEVALIVNPTLSDVDLLRTLVADLRIEPEIEMVAAPAARPRRIDDSEDGEGSAVEISKEKRPSTPSNWVNRAGKKELLDALNRFLLDQHAKGGSTVVIIDEAQNLALEVMEELRLLSNLETEKEKLLQIIFVGQKELEEKLKSPELKQLRQRISIQYELQPLSLDETRNYIDHRILIACGATPTTFSHGAIKEIQSYSRGYPRLINLACDRALLGGFNAKVDRIEASHVRDGIRSLLGDEGKGFFLKRFCKERLPLLISILFFVAGLVFFVGGGKGGFPRMQKWVETKWHQVFPQKTAAATSPVKFKPASAAAIAAPASKALPTDSKEKKAQSAEKETVVTVPEPKTSVVSTEKQKISVLTPQESGGYYRIQVFSSKKKQEAESLISELEKEGYTSFIKEVRSTGKPWYVVYVGPYDALEKARIHLNALKFAGRTPILLSISRSG